MNTTISALPFAVHDFTHSYLDTRLHVSLWHGSIGIQVERVWRRSHILLPGLWQKTQEGSPRAISGPGAPLMLLPPPEAPRSPQRCLLPPPPSAGQQLQPAGPEEGHPPGPQEAEGTAQLPPGTHSTHPLMQEGFAPEVQGFCCGPQTLAPRLPDRCTAPAGRQHHFHAIKCTRQRHASILQAGSCEFLL